MHNSLNKLGNKSMGNPWVKSMHFPNNNSWLEIPSSAEYPKDSWYLKALVCRFSFHLPAIIYYFKVIATAVLDTANMALFGHSSVIYIHQNTGLIWWVFQIANLLALT